MSSTKILYVYSSTGKYVLAGFVFAEEGDSHLALIIQNVQNITNIYTINFTKN